ncbi:hypothetical protein AQ505_12150 [Pedobacter sp. PACM 27299]|uniref:DUF4255 domain-containing protein n=1 Tax=Pedobacter sp. PACM 27299 TaxID=1727164 RepID=UPI0007068EAA|nr:DUF4255 domain-containing protein [Pedobacter sp. PACM 27299]ALL06176.1 hypothetical protein AQ505_12150 [Pedobacter sp. PACM 27299]
MINRALKFTSDALDQFLINRFALDESKVVMNKVIDSNGQVPMLNQNKIIVSLINIERETAKAYHIRNHPVSNGSFVNINPAERFNLDILMSANFDDYSESLKFLNAVILFFQVNTSLSVNNSSAFPIGLDKLEFDIEKLTYQQMHSLWTAMGAKYQPSVVYKMRLLTIQGFESDGFATSVSTMVNQVTQ